MPPDIDGMPSVPALSATSDTPVALTPEPVPNAAPDPVTEGDAAAAVETPAAESADSETGDDEQEGAAPEPPQLKRARETAQDRVQAAVRERRAAEQRADKLADSLEKAVEALSKTAQQPQQRPDQPEQAEPRPSRETFADPDSYDAALIEWSSRTATRIAAAEFERRQTEEKATNERTQADEAARKQHVALATSWGEKRAKLLEDPQYADFAEVAEAEDLQVPGSMVPALLEADNGPMVLYHLGKHPEEATRIAALSPMRQAIEIGRISASLEQSNRPPPRRPVPAVNPVGARNSAAPKSPDEMTTEEYAATRLPQLQSERRAGMWGRPPH